jgi:hypothetical protein
MLDKVGNELPLKSSMDHPFDILIPRDPTFNVPPLYRQYVTSQLNATSSQLHRLHFNLHRVDMTYLSNASVHLELRPLNVTLSYLLIYAFDRSPVLNSSTSRIDGWTRLCPSSRIR